MRCPLHTVCAASSQVLWKTFGSSCRQIDCAARFQYVPHFGQRACAIGHIDDFRHKELSPVRSKHHDKGIDLAQPESQVHVAQAQQVAVLQGRRPFRRKTLIVNVGPIDAVKILDPALIVTQRKSGMTTRQAGQFAHVGFQIEIGYHAAQRVRSAHDNRGLIVCKQWQSQTGLRYDEVRARRQRGTARLAEPGAV